MTTLRKRRRNTRGHLFVFGHGQLEEPLGLAPSISALGVLDEASHAHLHFDLHRAACAREAREQPHVSKTAIVKPKGGSSTLLPGPLLYRLKVQSRCLGEEDHVHVAHPHAHLLDIRVDLHKHALSSGDREGKREREATRTNSKAAPLRWSSVWARSVISKPQSCFIRPNSWHTSRACCRSIRNSTVGSSPSLAAAAVGTCLAA